MKQSVLLPIWALALLCVWCTSVDFNNPLDAKGKNYIGDELAGDHDGDGIPNKYDEDYQRVKDTTAPVITFVGGDTVLFMQNDPAQVLSRDTARAMDDFNGDLSNDIEIIPGIFISQCGVQQVTYRVSDKAGNIASRQRTIMVDCEAPVITLAGENPMNLRVGDTYAEPGATAADNFDGTIAANNITITQNVRTATEHVDTVTYTTTDRAGNVATKKRIVIVTLSPDTEPPVITLKGANPLSLREGTPYVEPGWTVTDNRDTDLQDKVEVIGGPVNTTVPGRDTLTYTVADKAGNTASVKRIIVITPIGPVNDTIPPTISLVGGIDIEIKVGEAFVEPGWTAIDNVDGDLTDKVTVRELNGKPINPMNTSVPGTFELIYSVTDSAGNKMEVGRTVRVVGVNTDTVKPVLALTGKVNDTVDLGKNYPDPGATATDDVDGVITSSIVKVYKNAAGTTVQPSVLAPASDTGRYTITYSVSDKAGNAATPVVRNVYVRDTFIDPNNLLLKYGVPLAAALPTINKDYKGGVTTDGTGAPNVSSITGLTLNWSLENKQIHYMAFDLSVDPWHKPLSPTHTFDQARPGFTLTGSGITGLDGEYYIKADATQCVWVRKDGRFAIIFR
ncbi:MAG: DUF5011 domain-containing protein [Chitinispirillaceae bacterium]|nr:DUF5011 domain-containing protein [Chitinispirillaceae bacterium]